MTSRARKRRPASPPTPPRRGGAGTWSGWDWLVPSLVAIALAAPRLRLGYFWDDYTFLTLGGSGDPWHFIRPDPTFTFYRPIPQGLYMLFLRWIDPHSGAVGHWINLALLVASVALLARLASLLAGRWAGFLAGLALASLGAAPSLAAWVSCSHDLFAMLFLLLAFHFRHAGRLGASLVATACALLSKESAAALLPALAFWDSLVGREPPRVARGVIAFGVLTLGWMGLHPGMRTLMGHGFLAGATGYVGLAYPERWTFYLVRYLLTLANIPITGTATAWTAELGEPAIAALAIATIGFAIAWRSFAPSPRVAPPLPPRRLLWISALLAIPPLLLPSLFVRHWAPYFAVAGAFGTSLLLGAQLSRLRPWIALPAVGAFLLLGVWCRGLLIPNEKVWSEPVLVDASQAIDRVERKFRELTPSPPRGAQLLLSVGATGTRGIASTMIDGQAPSIWYEDPTLYSSTVEARRAGYPEDLLYRVTEELEVALIDPVAGRYRATTEQLLPAETARPVRTYARAVAASGETDLAIRILDRLAELDEGEYRSMDLRLAASAARAAGRIGQADSILARAEPLPRETALLLLARVFGNPTASAALDSSAYWAFGVSPDDPEAIAFYLEIFRGLKNPTQIEHFAKRLDVLLPGNERSRDALRQISAP